MDARAEVSWLGPAIFVVALVGFVAAMAWLAYNPPRGHRDQDGEKRH